MNLKQLLMKKIAFLLAFLVLLGVQLVNAQTKTISGTVTDAGDGSTIPGVTVVAKGYSGIGTITNEDGKYTLIIPAATTHLIFSYIGMKTIEVPVVGLTVANAALDVSELGLEEVVITALGISRETKSLGYAVQEISGEAVNEVRETNFVNSLSGKVAGLHIRQSNTMGGSANVLIRGMNSLTQNNQALFVVDGVPIDNNNTNNDRLAANDDDSYQNDGWGGYDYGNAAMDINPDDIESISVLKGAAAAALYGSRASNGVVLITTKRGKKGPIQGIGITVNSGLALSQIDKNTAPKWQKKYGGGYGPFYEDPSEYFFHSDIDGDGQLDLIAPTSEDASWGAAFDPDLMVVHWDALDPLADNYGEKRPWVAGANDYTSFFRTGTKWTNSVAFDGANDFGNFRLSYTNVDQKGLLPNSSIKKNTINFGSTYNFTDRMSVDASITYINTNGIGRYGTGYDGMNPMQSFGQWIQTNVDFDRLEDRYLRADGNQLSWNHGYYDDLHPIYFDNPYWTRYKNYESDERNRVFGFTGINYKINNWLTLTGRLSLDSYSETQNERIAVGSVDPSYYSNFTRKFNELNTDVMLKFNRHFGDFSLNGVLGTNMRQQTVESVLGETVGGLVVPGLYSISNSVSPVAITEALRELGTNSGYASVSLGYKNFLYLDITDRYDVSSTLPKEDNAYNYYSVSTSLVMSELGGLKDMEWLTFAKLRANYAQVGNDAPVYSTISTYEQGTNWGDLSLFSVNSTLQNPNLLPERTNSVELGLDLRMFKNRLSLDLAVYKTNTFDQIMPVLVSKSSGYDRTFVNGGEIENKGIEIAAIATPVQTSDFTWNLGVNWFTNKNKVISLYGDVENHLIYSAWDVSINASVGEPYGVIKGTDFVYTDGKKTVDEDGYYMVSDSPDEVIGNINPDWNMGISNQFNYKAFSLSVLFDFQKGGDIYSINTKYGQATGVYEETAELNDKGNPMRDQVEDGGGYLYPNTVNEDGTPNTTYVPAFRWGRAFYYNNSPTARYVFDASYVKLRELALSYRLPVSVISRTPFTNITFSIVGRNVAVLFKNTKHFDPENGLGSGNQQGIETGAYPTARTIGFNLKLGI